MPTRPQLVQFGDLRAAHFAAHAVWVACHSVDEDAEWFDETDEETFRPGPARRPADAADAMYLVAAEFTLADGTQLDGFVTPALPSDASMGTWQPHLFAPDGLAQGFWTGMMGMTPEQRGDVYRRLNRVADAVFPIHFRARPGLTVQPTEGRIEGFYRITGLRAPPEVER